MSEQHGFREHLAFHIRFRAAFNLLNAFTSTNITDPFPKVITQSMEIVEVYTHAQSNVASIWPGVWLCLHDADSMLGHRVRCWPSIKPVLNQRLWNRQWNRQLNILHISKCMICLIKGYIIYIYRTLARYQQGM